MPRWGMNRHSIARNASAIVRDDLQVYGSSGQTDEDRDKCLICPVSAVLGGAQLDGPGVVYPGMKEGLHWCYAFKREITHGLLRGCRSFF